MASTAAHHRHHAPRASRSCAAWWPAGPAIALSAGMAVCGRPAALVGAAGARRWPASLAGLATTRTDLTPKDLARVEAITRPTTDFSKPEQFELMQGGAGTSQQAGQPGRLLAFLGQHHLRGRGHLQARQRAVPQGLGVVALLDAGVRRARAALQCARLPELPSEGRARPSAGGQSPTRPRCSCGWRARPRREEEKAAVADRTVLNFPDPVYGGQLQDLAVPGLAGEGQDGDRLSRKCR